MSRTLALALLLRSPSRRRTAALKAARSVEQVHVTGAKRGAKLKLAGRTTRAGSLGGAIFRNAKAGTTACAGSGWVLPARSAPPSTKGYRQKLPREATAT